MPPGGLQYSFGKTTMPAVRRRQTVVYDNQTRAAEETGTLGQPRAGTRSAAGRRQLAPAVPNSPSSRSAQEPGSGAEGVAPSKAASPPLRVSVALFDNETDVDRMLAVAEKLAT
jgi:hypothetical protein